MVASVRGHRSDSRKEPRSALALEKLESRQMLAASVVGRHIFYNNSAFDGNDLAINAADDAAIATDKTAHEPGQIATFANYTSYSRGINGIMIDVESLADPGQISLRDFQFRTGREDDVANWLTAPNPSEIVVRPDAGTNGSDRITLVWPDNAIDNEWLHVTVNATPQTGLEAPDAFIFGNAIGESGDRLSSAIVDVQDERGPRENPHAFFDLAEIEDAYDYNRDRYVNATDQIIARSNANTIATSLELLGRPQLMVTIVYDPETGSFSIVSDRDLDTIEIISESGLFEPDQLNADIFDGLFDVVSENKLFRLDPGGFDALDFGIALPPDLTEEFLLQDLNIDGSFVGGGGLGAVDIVVLPSVPVVGLLYDAATGNFSVDSGELTLSSIEIVSSSGVFTETSATGLGGPEDIDTDEQIFKKDDNGFTQVDFGPVMPTGLTEAFLLNDLMVGGTDVDGNALERIRFFVGNEITTVTASYDSDTATLTIDGPRLQSFEVQSASGLFTGLPADELVGPNDVDTDEQLLIQDEQGFQKHNASTGELSLDSGLILSTVEIVSTAGIFTGDPAMNLGGNFDVDNDHKIFKLSPEGFSQVTFGNVAIPGLPRSFIEQDLSILGSRLPAGPIGNYAFDVIPVVNEANVFYDASTGDIFVDSNPPISDLELTSDFGIFTGAPAIGLGGPNDIDSDAMIFKQDDNGFSNVSLGPVAQSGLRESFVTTDLRAVANRVGGGQQNTQVFVLPHQPLITLIYDGATGEISLLTNSPLESIDIVSATSVFTGSPAENVDGPNDVDSDSRILKRELRGFMNFSLGNVAIPGLDTTIADDISITATYLGGESVTDIELEIIPDTGETVVTFNASTGSIVVDTNLTLEELRIESNRGVFSGLPAIGFDGPSDIDTDSLLVKIDEDGFRSIQLDQVALVGLTSAFVSRDLAFSGRRVGGGGLGQLTLNVTEVDQSIQLIYGGATGHLRLESGLALESIDIMSATGIFTGIDPVNLDGENDIDSDSRIFKHDQNGFSNIDFGDVASSGWSSEFLATDLTVSATLFGGEATDDIEILAEPDMRVTTVLFNTDTRELSVSTDVVLSEIVISSTWGIFTGDAAQNLGGPDDIDTDTTIRKQDSSGFTSVSFGSVGAADLKSPFVVEDLSVTATRLGGAPLENIQIVVEPAEVNLVYHAATGELELRTPFTLDTFEVTSNGGSFFGTNCENLASLFDVCTTAKYFKLDPRGFGSITLGMVLPPGLTRDFLVQDLRIDGSFKGGGNIRPVEIVVIPDPPGAVAGEIDEDVLRQQLIMRQLRVEQAIGAVIAGAFVRENEFHRVQVNRNGPLERRNIAGDFEMELNQPRQNRGLRGGRRQPMQHRRPMVDFVLEEDNWSIEDEIADELSVRKAMVA